MLYVQVDNMHAPKVFISYSWTSDEYADQVMELATRLRGNMVDVVLDRWDLKTGQDKFVFMEQMVTDPTMQKVLVLCDKRYAERADRREGGVGTESTIISQEVYNQVSQEKFIPVVMERDAGGEPFLPVFLKSRMYIDLSDPRRYEAGYEELVRNIGGQPVHVKPPLGQAPSFMAQGNRPTAPTTHARKAFEDALLRDKRYATGLATDYLNTLLDTLRAQRLDVKELPIKEEISGLMLGRLAQWTPLRDEFVDYLRFTSQYGSDPRLFEDLTRFFEKALAVTTGRYSDQVNEHINFIVHEAFLYAVTVLLEQEHFDPVSALLGAYYRDAEEETRLQRFGIFAHLKTAYLERVAQTTWDTRYTYPHPLWKLTQDRATNESVAFAALRQTDFVLHLRYLLEEKGQSFSVPGLLSWFPVTFSLDHLFERDSPFPIFSRATSRRYFARFKQVLGVESKQDLLERWNAAFQPDAETAGRMRANRATLLQSVVRLDLLDTTA